MKSFDVSNIQIKIVNYQTYELDASYDQTLSVQINRKFLMQQNGLIHAIIPSEINRRASEFGKNSSILNKSMNPRT